jgi:hypothetical protein
VQSQQVGQFTSRLANDSNMVSEGVATQLAAGITALALVISAMVSLFAVNWFVTTSVTPRHPRC